MILDHRVGMEGEFWMRTNDMGLRHWLVVAACAVCLGAAGGAATAWAQQQKAGDAVPAPTPAKPPTNAVGAGSSWSTDVKDNTPSQAAGIDTAKLDLVRKVDAYFNGHTHDFERGLLNGVTSYIIGGAGGTLDPWARDVAHITEYYSVHHFVSVSVDGPVMDIDAIDLDGNVFDTWQIVN